jgi:putative ABC transport system permease protein
MIKNIPAVESVEPWLQASFAFKDTSGGALLYGTTPQANALPPVVSKVRAKVFPLNVGEVILPKQADGTDLSRFLGKSINVSYTRKVGEGQGEPVSDNVNVVGLYDPAYQEDGPGAAYADPSLVIKWAAARSGVPTADYLSVVGYRQTSVIVRDAHLVGDVLSQVRSMKFEAVSLATKLHQLPQSMKLLQWLGYVITAALIAYSVLAGYTVCSGFIRTRTREIGTLKALGFAKSRVTRIFLLELTLIGFVATFTGVVLGNIISVAIGKLLQGGTFLGVRMTDRLALPGAAWSLLFFVVPCLACVVGGLSPARRAASMPPDIALRDW